MTFCRFCAKTISKSNSYESKDPRWSIFKGQTFYMCPKCFSFWCSDNEEELHNVIKSKLLNTSPSSQYEKEEVQT